jgi:CPA2 family monovalent cation:H+ antiporter-2
MSDAHAVLQNLALVFCVAAVTTVVFHRLRQPVVFGYLLAGMIVGPHLPVPLVADESTVRTLSELGVILLMFSLGLEFSLRRVVKVAGSSGLAALAETSVMLGLGFLIAQALGWTTVESVFAGGMVAISSTTIVAKAFAEHGVRGRVTEVVFGILIVEDLIAILLVAVLTAVASGEGLSPGDLAMTSVRLATFLIALVAVGLLVVPRLMRAVMRADSREMTLVASVGVCFAAALVALSFGYSVALGAFIAGTLVAESGEGKAIEAIVEPVRDLFVAIFFVSVGMLIDPRVLVEHWGAVVALTLLVIGGKIVAVTIGAFFTGNGLRSSVQAGMSLAQIGEFSFIIAAVGTATGAIRPFLYPVAIAVSAITTLTTPWLIRAAGPAALMLDRKLPRPVQTFVALYGSWIESLRQSSAAKGGRARIRRLVRLLILDAVLLLVVIVGASAEMARFTALLGAWLGLSEKLARLVIIAGTLVIVVPLLAGLVRVSWWLALALAVRAMPAARAGTVDLAQAPRTALIITLRIAILLGVLAPITAITQPFVRGIPTVAALLIALATLTLAFWRAARDLQGHARAGAEVIVSALAQQMATDSSPTELSRTMEHLSVVLPGLGEPTSIILQPDSPAVGHTLADINLRGLTGATVLGISRSAKAEQHTLVPAGHERLRSGDVLIIGGPNEAVEAARDILATGYHSRTPARAREKQRAPV